MEKKEIKIVGLDLDGTLLTDKKELLPYTKNVIGEALQNGTVVLVATGRPWTGVPEELRELPGMDYALTANGARIIETRTGKILEEHLLSKEAAKKAIAIGRKYDTLLEVYFDGQGYAQKDEIAQVRKYHKNPNMWDYFLRTRIAVDRLEDLLDEKEGNPDAIQFPKAKVNDAEYDFSFSGLKSAVTEAKLPGEGGTKNAANPEKRLAAVLSGVPERI